MLSPIHHVTLCHNKPSLYRARIQTETEINALRVCLHCGFIQIFCEYPELIIRISFYTGF